MRMERIVIKLSGKVFDNPNKESLLAYASIFKDMLNDDIQPIIVAGGGPIARYYINIARSLHADESSLDELGIIVSRLNARLLIHALDAYAYSNVPEDLAQLRQALYSNKVIVTGGLQVAQSTNATAAIIAEASDARMFINATDVDGIYTSDPKKDKDAKLLASISVNDLMQLLLKQDVSAGGYDLMDIVALKIIERSRMKVRVVKAEPEIIKDAVYGKSIGTLIT